MVIQYKSSDGLFLITIGQNAKENDSIRFKALQNDLWFHLENKASPHVILSSFFPSSDNNSTTFSKEAIYEAASLCKAFSKEKNCNAIQVIYTQVKKVKGIKEIDGRVEVKGHVEKLKVYKDDEIKDNLVKVK
ncbi:hypothetical protein ABK040_010621 [Willaertia magna]